MPYLLLVVGTRLPPYWIPLVLENPLISPMKALDSIPMFVNYHCLYLHFLPPTDWDNDAQMTNRSGMKWMFVDRDDITRLYHFLGRFLLNRQKELRGYLVCMYIYMSIYIYRYDTCSNNINSPVTVLLLVIICLDSSKTGPQNP